MLLYSVLHPPRTREHHDSDDAFHESERLPFYEYETNEVQRANSGAQMSNPHSVSAFSTARVHRDPDGKGIATTVFPARSGFHSPLKSPESMNPARGGYFDAGRRGSNESITGFGRRGSEDSVISIDTDKSVPAIPGSFRVDAVKGRERSKSEGDEGKTHDKRRDFMKMVIGV